jgi:hypothetical protein
MVFRRPNQDQWLQITIHPTRAAVAVVSLTIQPSFS